MTRTDEAVVTAKERPILFSAPMVRAILAGAKTQTRRVMKPQPPHGREMRHAAPGSVSWDEVSPSIQLGGGVSLPVQIHGARHCPYGAPGDRLWVRETWGWCRKNGGHVVFAAEGDGWETCHPGNPTTGEAAPYSWRSPIHMPRWASRNTLEVTGVRVERVQAITEDDARAEGAQRFDGIPDPHPYKQGARWSMEAPTTTADCLGSARFAFAALWDSINAKRGHGWDVNPWCWVLDFRRIEAPDNDS